MKKKKQDRGIKSGKRESLLIANDELQNELHHPLSVLKFTTAFSPCLSILL